MIYAVDTKMHEERGKKKGEKIRKNIVTEHKEWRGFWERRSKRREINKEKKMRMKRIA